MRGSSLVGGSAGGQPRGERSIASRPKYLPGPAGAQSKPRGQERWRTEAYGVGAPETASFSASSVALVLGVPQFGAEFPRPGRRGSRQSIAARPPAINNVKHSPPSRGMLPPRTVRLAVPEALFVESDLLGEHVINGPRQLGGEDAHGLGRSALLLLLFLPATSPLIALSRDGRYALFWRCEGKLRLLEIPRCRAGKNTPTPNRCCGPATGKGEGVRSRPLLTPDPSFALCSGPTSNLHFAFASPVNQH